MKNSGIFCFFLRKRVILEPDSKVDSIVLIAVLTQYLESHKRLVIPQLGTFIVKEPGRSILFSELLKRDDGVLRRLLSERGMNELEAAGETVTEFEGYKFEIGKGVVMRPGRDAAIIATGNMVATALKAAALLEAEGLDVRVIDMHTIKPIDRRLVLEAARETGAIVTSEEHNVLGGLGGAVAEVVGEEYPVPVLRHGMRDCFGKSGKHDDVLALFGLTETVLADTVRRAAALKK